MFLIYNIESCYLIGIPLEVKTNIFVEELTKRSLPHPSSWELKPHFDSFGTKCKYVYM